MRACKPVWQRISLFGEAIARGETVIAELPLIKANSQRNIRFFPWKLIILPVYRTNEALHAKEAEAGVNHIRCIMD